MGYIPATLYPNSRLSRASQARSRMATSGCLHLQCARKGRVSVLEQNPFLLVCQLHAGPWVCAGGVAEAGKTVGAPGGAGASADSAQAGQPQFRPVLCPNPGASQRSSNNSHALILHCCQADQDIRCSNHKGMKEQVWLYRHMHGWLWGRCASRTKPPPRSACPASSRSLAAPPILR